MDKNKPMPSPVAARAVLEWLRRMDPAETVDAFERRNELQSWLARQYGVDELEFIQAKYLDHDVLVKLAAMEREEQPHRREHGMGR